MSELVWILLDLKLNLRSKKTVDLHPALTVSLDQIGAIKIQRQQKNMLLEVHI